MSTPISLSGAPPRTTTHLTTVRGATFAVVGSVGVWSVIVGLHALAEYSDQVRRGGGSTLGALLGSYALAYIPWAGLSSVLYLYFRRESERLSDPWRIARWFLATFALFYLPQVAYQIALSQPARGRPFVEIAVRWPVIFWLIDAMLLVTSFTVIYALVAVQVNLAARFRQHRIEAEVLALRLDLEQQRLRALRAQLEPHFVFNALNAIASLVRSGERSFAITAIGQLSGLLRYALTATGTDWVTIDDELRFVREYLALQHLRYGERLRVGIDGVAATVGSADCPPLLLQPLVENAIRHDLERHDGASDIRLTLASEGSEVVIRISNSVHPDAPSNPGLGLGLRATRDRLALAYGGRAVLSAERTGDRFDVMLRLPRSAHD